MKKQVVVDLFKETLILIVGALLAGLLPTHWEVAYFVGVICGEIIVMYRRYLSIRRASSGESLNRVLDKTDSREIQCATRTCANNADKSDISKKHGISASTSDHTAKEDRLAGIRTRQQ